MDIALLYSYLLVSNGSLLMDMLNLMIHYFIRKMIMGRDSLSIYITKNISYHEKTVE